MAVLAPLRARLIAFAVAISMALAAMAHAQAPAAGVEASVKAVFLYNFAKFVTWPAGGAIRERSPAEIRICLPSRGEFFTLLEAAVRGENVSGRPLVPVALDGLDAARSCQILYVGDTRSADARAWLQSVRGRQVLTVGDGEASDDVVIAFVRVGDRLRFDINRGAEGRHGLNISSKLLRLARQVREP
jgi:YfiR/HmsC-like